MVNADIREKIRKKRLHQYEVANRIGISETTFCVWLRNELSADRKERVMKAINSF